MLFKVSSTLFFSLGTAVAVGLLLKECNNMNYSASSPQVKDESISCEVSSKEKD